MRFLSVRRCSPIVLTVFFGGCGPSIDRFDLSSRCFLPSPGRGIISYSVTGTPPLQVTVAAVHQSSLAERPFHGRGQTNPGPLTFGPIADPGATVDVVSYQLTAVDANGSTTVSRDAEYRRTEFELVGPAGHLRDTSDSDHYARYWAPARMLNVDSLSCRFFLTPPGPGNRGRAGTAFVTTLPGSQPAVACEINWGNLNNARAGGVVEWVATVVDPCTQGVFIRTATVPRIS